MTLKTLRAARAELLFPLLDREPVRLNVSTYSLLQGRTGMTRREVQHAIDDLVADGRCVLEIEDSAIFVRSVGGVQAPGRGLGDERPGAFSPSPPQEPS